MLLIDLKQGRIVSDEEIKAELATAQPYKQWLARTQIVLEDLPEVPAGAAERRSAARSPAGLRLHAGRPEADPAADGDHRPGSRGLDGHRHADLGAVGQVEAPLHLFQAELRAGDQPADRLDPRGTGDEPRELHRPAPEHPRSRGPRLAPAPRSAPADPHQRGSRKDPRHRRHGGQPVPLEDARHHLPGVGRRRRYGRRRSTSCSPMPKWPCMRATTSSSCPTAHGPRPGGDPCPAGDGGRPPSPDPQGPPHLGRPRGRDRRSARNASFLRPRRLWRRSDQPLSRLRDAGGDEGRPAGARSRRARAGLSLHQGDR